MSNGVESHVNGRVGKRLNKELRVPRESGTLTKVPGDSPFLEPVNSFFKGGEDTGIVGVEAVRFNVLLDGFLPFGLSVLNIPLVTECNNADL